MRSYSTGQQEPQLSLCHTDSMDIELSPPSPSPPYSRYTTISLSCGNVSPLLPREWSPEEESTMELLQPVETALRNSRSTDPLSCLH